MVQFLINKTDETGTLACVAKRFQSRYCAKVRAGAEKIGRGKETLATQATVTCNRDLAVECDM